ncbi:STAS domain-containing protein [Alteromonas sp. a30]|uniref:STAS domain-containing protein n=1 Tax=Alteromonas sp. a30 TaxID=2730917 RepID=UPI00227E6F72|nr:STAS domain-containing protein [Alteromonas sp. a30]MCY7294815.1 STAS domain-containing protein [Alteromonas sp. a30]
MASACEVLKISENQIQLKGILDWQSVADALFKVRESFKQISDDTIILELSELKHADTAGVAGLINASIDCIKDGKKLQLLNAPEIVSTLAKISDLEAVLGLQ